MPPVFFESFAGAHHIDVDEPEEDLGLLRHTFVSWSNTNVYQVPEYGRWLAAADARPAYGYHRRAIQHFTWQRRLKNPGPYAQWLLKAPVHLMELEALIDVYPDACFIQTHRDPRAVDRLMGQPDRATPFPHHRAHLPPRPRRGAAC